ncbi:virulence protein RhuM/Fic/DOC family protein [Bifidobacterium simiarum]|uniref:Death-on-curing family protein n=1 Tax=Bifidobacterium simiarum TaxID=2045441 RepID=A0A2M9HHC0_9BIFI|nr:virulence protein RhuM/Fic/DOC family protein [Bifidobacterium simiarum]PJM76197.1 death-on-curing family protein [Bifidobacterium simiarum]
MGTNDIELYRSDDGSVQLEVNVRGDTVWLSRDQMAELFGRNKSTISRHVRNVFDEGELNHDESVVAKFATTAADGKTYMVDYYNLDVVISVGYRVKSQRGVQFRRWATSVLRRYLMEGYAVNERRLNQLEKVVKVLARSDDRLASGIADVVSSYLPGLNMLRDYDAHALDPKPLTAPVWEFTVADARVMADRLRKEYPDDTLLGQERGDALERIIGAVYQSFAGQDLYPTVEEKAAHLLYFIVKDHPFADGNKRMAAAAFVSFLEGNDAAFGKDGGPVITNNDLVAITLLIAVSDPGEKDLMIDLVERMLTVREDDDEQQD